MELEVLRDVFAGKRLSFEEFQAAWQASGQSVDAADALMRQFRAAQRKIFALKRAMQAEDPAALREEAAVWKRLYEETKRDAAVDLAIMQAKGRNVKAIRALLDLDRVKLKKDGTLEGLNLEAVKKSDGYLFEDTVFSREGRNAFSGRGRKESLLQRQFEDAVWKR